MKFILSAVLCVVYIHACSAEEDHCKQSCPPSIVDPICATNGAKFQKFRQFCDLNEGNCHLKENFLPIFKETDMAWCSSTYVQLLELSEKLGIQDRPECNHLCSRESTPICASNGEYHSTFDNECVWKSFNCDVSLNENLKQFNIFRYGECFNELSMEDDW